MLQVCYFKELVTEISSEYTNRKQNITDFIKNIRIFVYITLNIMK